MTACLHEVNARCPPLALQCENWCTYVSAYSKHSNHTSAIMQKTLDRKDGIYSVAEQGKEKQKFKSKTVRQ